MHGIIRGEHGVQPGLPFISGNEQCGMYRGWDARLVLGVSAVLLRACVFAPFYRASMRLDALACLHIDLKNVQ